jgi:hypothetical protein
MRGQVDDPLAEEVRRAAFSRVAASKTFSRSPRLNSLLKYLGEAPMDCLTEHQIGMQVFGRPESYNKMEDNIVRSSARLLRQKLEEYYRTEGAGDTIRISIPRGRYVPELVTAEVEPSAAQGPAPMDAPSRRKWIGWAAGGAALAATAAGIGYVATTSRAARPNALSQLWSQLLDARRRTFVVLSDTAYVLVQDALETAIPVEEYFNSDQWNKWASRATQRSGIRTLGYRRYTGVVDAEFALRVAKRPEAQGVEVLVRFARDLSVQDARGANLLVLGAPHANPWVSLLDGNANFRVNLDFADHEFHIANRKPRAGEPASWLADELRRVYGVASFLPKPDGDGHMLLMEGATIAGTETAKDLFLNTSRFAAFLQTIQPGSSKVPHFESVWETTSLSGNAPAAKLVAFRTSPTSTFPSSDERRGVTP